jgi:hypothetical protein
MNKKVIVAGVAGAFVIIVALFMLSSIRARKPGTSSKGDVATKSSVEQQSEALTETVEGDGFNTDELDTGVRKESKSTAGLGMGAYDETEASTEASEPETYAETDAEGKNLTEPAQTIPTVEQGLSASEYGQIAESIQQQNNAVITDTSSDDSIGKDVDDSIRALQEQDLENAKRAWASPEFQKYLESYRAND